MQRPARVDGPPVAVTGLDVVNVTCNAPGGRPVLSDVTLALAPGELVVVSGANGSGKSTFARILAGVDRPTSGSVRRPARCHLIPEHAPALPGSSARVLAAAFGARVPSNGRESRLADALDALGSSHGPSARLRELSKGTVQKAHLAVAYAIRPSLLVADEPLSGLDPAAAVAAAELLAGLAEAGSIVLLLAHAPMSLARRSYELRGGALHETAAGSRPSRGFLVHLAPPDQVVAATARGGLERPSNVRLVDAATAELRVSRDDLPATLRWALDAGLDVVRVVEDGRG